MIEQKIRIRLFGSLSEFGEGGSAELIFPQVATVLELKSALGQYFGENSYSKALEILEASAFADDTKVLSSSTSLLGVSSVAVLPPVCGG